MIVAAEAVAVALACAAAAAGAPPWPAAAAGIAAAAALAVPFRSHSPLAAGLLRARMMLRRRGRLGPRPAGPAMSAPPADDTPDPPPGTADAGFRWDGEELLCAIEVRASLGTVRTVSPAGACSPGGPRLSAAQLAPLLDQFDIRLAGIDVHSMTMRAAGPAVVARIAARLTGPLTAAARRDTVVVLRLDPAACPEAVARRGGGTGGAARAVRTAAARLIRVLERSGLTGTMLTATDLEAAAGLFTGHPAAAPPRPAWGHAAAGGRVHTAHRLPAPDAGAWAGLWDPDCRAAVVSMAVRRGGDGGSVRVGALVRYIADHPVAPPPSAGAVALTGRQCDALHAGTPRATGLLEALSAPRPMSLVRADAAAVPVGADGQLVGGTRDGHAVFATLTGPGIARLAIHGGAHLARQTLLRALVTGVRALVITDRPGGWRNLEAEVADPAALRVDVGGTTPSGTVMAPGGSLTREDMVGFGLVLIDCVDGRPGLPPVPDDATVALVMPPGGPDTGLPDADTEPLDASICADPHRPDVLRVQVHGARAEAGPVTIPDETRVTGRPD